MIAVEARRCGRPAADDMPRAGTGAIRHLPRSAYAAMTSPTRTPLTSATNAEVRKR